MKIFEKEVNVGQLIKNAEDEKLWLPEFQRPFVWDKSQIRLLIDSLFNNYTISSILIWEGGDELARRRVGGSIKEIKIPKGDAERVIYLLDGQQRTTALLLAFTDKPIYKGSGRKPEALTIYWDSEYQGFDPELRWLLADEQILLHGSEDEHLSLSELSEEEIFNRFGSRFIKLKHAFELDNFLKEWQGKVEAGLLLEYYRKVNTIKEKVLQRRVHDIEQPGELEEVLEVFERINTKNTKLSVYDIMVAKTYRKVGDSYFDLRSYFKVLSYEDSVKPDYFQTLEEIDLDKIDLKVDEDLMLFLVMVMLKKDFKATQILKLRTDELLQNIKPLHDKYQYLLGLMKKQFNIEYEELYKYQPILKFLAAAITHFPKINLEQQDFLTKWFWNTLIKNRYPGAQNERIAKDFGYIEKMDLSSALQKMQLDNTRNFDNVEKLLEKSIIGFEAYYNSSGQQIYRAFLQLLKSREAKDFYSGFPPSKSGASAHLLEEHHIFPKSSKMGKDIIKRYAETTTPEVINNIANIALLTKETNGSRIRAKNPGEYILQFEEDYKKAKKLDQFYEIMQSQFITKKMIELLKADDFEGFMKARTLELKTQIDSLCKI